MKIIVSDKLKSDSETIKENIDNFSKIIDQIGPFLDIIKQNWEGTDATSFFEKYEEVLVNLKKYRDELNNYYDFLSKVYDIYNTLDKSYDKPISG